MCNRAVTRVVNARRRGVSTFVMQRLSDIAASLFQHIHCIVTPGLLFFLGQASISKACFQSCRFRCRVLDELCPCLLDKSCGLKFPAGGADHSMASSEVIPEPPSPWSKTFAMTCQGSMVHFASLLVGNMGFLDPRPHEQSRNPPSIRKTALTMKLCLALRDRFLGTPVCCGNRTRLP